VLQSLEDGRWRDYVVNGKPVVAPFDIEGLPSGEYRLGYSGDSLPNSCFAESFLAWPINN
jgi:hypothetical protein